ncbi:PAS domain-containing protein [Euzebya sp.]|uniref:PAS domain-containing protein n=1 Tax=Euzebya sp. TaxID=1971409 RepID=UPI003513E473
MERTAPQPTGRERPFGVEELFFSTTDLKGRILSGNEVFTRISGYGEGQLVGSPHNIIRHPDMPRAVFRLLWDFIQSGRPIAAYVKNMAADGCHYWVMASVVPIDGGYLSIRLKPTSDVFGLVVPLYAELREIERLVDLDGRPRAHERGMDAAAERLAQRLAEAGFDGYEAFMRAGFTAEVTARQAALGTAGAHGRRHGGGAHERADLHGLLDACTTVHDFLVQLLRDIEAYATLNRTLADRSEYVLGLAEQIRLFSLNAQLASDRLGVRGATLSAVAGIMRGHFTTIRPQIEALGGDIDRAVDLLGDLGFRIAVSNLQTEMATVFIGELLATGDGGAGADLRVLTRCLVDSVEDLLGLQERLGGLLTSLAAHAGHVRTELESIRVLAVDGRIEGARAHIGGAVVELFGTISAQVGTARQELGAFGDVDTVAAGSRDRARVAAVRRELERIGHLAAQPTTQPTAPVS